MLLGDKIINMRLLEKYQKDISPKLSKKFGYKNALEVPKLTKVVINVGVGRHAKEKGFIEDVVRNITIISGQKPMQTKAKKSISSFKIREGMVVGVAVTMRGKRMYDFVDKLINVSLPRVRDFRGISEKLVDSSGNLTIGLKEQMVFPEIRADEIENFHGIEISLVNNAKKREEGLELYRLMGFPFKKDE
jgi:large subunit ribosomal protein L5